MLQKWVIDVFVRIVLTKSTDEKSFEILVGIHLGYVQMITTMTKMTAAEFDAYQKTKKKKWGKIA